MAKLCVKIEDTAGNFQALVFSHEVRMTNIDAHNLARSCISLDLGRHVWFLNPPEGVCKQQGQQVSDALFSSQGTLGDWEVFNEAACVPVIKNLKKIVKFSVYRILFSLN